MEKIKIVELIPANMKLSEKSKAILDNNMAKIAETNAALEVKIIANETGKIINNRVHPGVLVRNNYSLWTEGSYKRKVFRHHRALDSFFGPSAEDPIGIVIGQSFKQIAKGNDFRRDYENPAGDGSHGSGIGYLDLRITDPTAISRILDGTYETVSTGVMSSFLRCSICSQHMYSEKCGHVPGEYYGVENENGKETQKLCYGILGSWTPIEVSFVNIPALEYAKVIEINKESGLFFMPYKDYMKPQFLLRDSEGNETGLLLAEDEKSLDLDQMESREIIEISIEDKESEIEMEKDKKEDDAPEDVVAAATSASPVGDVRSSSATSEDTNKDDKNSGESNFIYTDEEFARKHIVWSIMKDSMLYIDDSDEGVEEEDLKYEALAEDFESFDILLQENEEVLDAKLSAKQRKALKSSTFCGPNRSFPVPDCSHVAAAKRLLPRYKGPGDKGRILACVNRKGKQLGCPGYTGKKDSGEAENLEKDMEMFKTEIENLKATVSSLKDEKAKVANELKATNLVNKKLTDELENLKEKAHTMACRLYVLVNREAEGSPAPCDLFKTATDLNVDELIDSVVSEEFLSKIDINSSALDVSLTDSKSEFKTEKTVTKTVEKVTSQDINAMLIIE